MQRYEEWMQLREIGIRRCEEQSLPLPTWLKDPPPPPPEPFHDEDIGEVSAEMIQHETAEASESFNLERSLADDQVPLADPEVEGSRPLMVSRDVDGDDMVPLLILCVHHCSRIHRSTHWLPLRHHLRRARMYAGKASSLVSIRLTLIPSFSLFAAELTETRPYSSRPGRHEGSAEPQEPGRFRPDGRTSYFAVNAWRCDRRRSLTTSFPSLPDWITLPFISLSSRQPFFAPL